MKTKTAKVTIARVPSVAARLSEIEKGIRSIRRLVQKSEENKNLLIGKLKYDRDSFRRDLAEITELVAKLNMTSGNLFNYALKIVPKEVKPEDVG